MLSTPSTLELHLESWACFDTKYVMWRQKHQVTTQEDESGIVNERTYSPRYWVLSLSFHRTLFPVLYSWQKNRTHCLRSILPVLAFKWPTRGFEHTKHRELGLYSSKLLAKCSAWLLTVLYFFLLNLHTKELWVIWSVRLPEEPLY